MGFANGERRMRNAQDGRGVDQAGLAWTESNEDREGAGDPHLDPHLCSHPCSPPVQGATVLHRLARLYKIAIRGAT
jgi:hypothetical protein